LIFDFHDCRGKAHPLHEIGVNLSFEEFDMPIIEWDARSVEANRPSPDRLLSRGHTDGGSENGEPTPPPQPPETPEEERGHPTQPELPDPAEVGEDG